MRLEDNLVVLPAINWGKMKGSSPTVSKINGWLTNRYIDGIASPFECLDEAETVVSMFNLMSEDKYGEWLRTFVTRELSGMTNDRPRYRQSDATQLMAILQGTIN